MSTRELITQNVLETIEDMANPRVNLVTREPFEIEKLAITQFPAVLVETGNELREDIAMGGLRRGTIEIQVRGFVRSDARKGSIINVDSKRNELIERLEEALNQMRDRSVDSTQQGLTVTTRVQQIQIQTRTPPLGEFLMTVEVRYNFTKGAV